MDEALRWVLDKLWVAIGALLGWLWHTNKQELAELRAAIAQKADKDELDRQRDNIATLFNEHTAIRRDMAKGFDDVKEAIHKGNMEIIRELAKKADR